MTTQIAKQVDNSFDQSNLESHNHMSLTCRFFCRSASTSARILCSCCVRTILFLIFATDGRLRVRSSSGTSSAVCGTAPIVSTKRSGLRARFFDRPRYSLELPVTLSPPLPPLPPGAERFRELICCQLPFQTNEG
jgi:hypothetical protein